jgi:hypothetical protein
MDTLTFLVGGNAHLTIVNLAVLGSYIVLAACDDLNLLDHTNFHNWTEYREVHFELALPLSTCVFVLYTVLVHRSPFAIIPKDEMPLSEQNSPQLEQRARKAVSFKPPFGENTHFVIFWAVLQADHAGAFLALLGEIALAPRRSVCPSLPVHQTMLMDLVFVVGYLFLLNGFRWRLIGKPCYPMQQEWYRRGMFLRMHTLLALSGLAMASPIRFTRTQALECL